MNKHFEDKDATLRLWAEYKKNPSPRLKTIIAEKYTPLVHKIAGSFSHKRPNVLDYDDLVQAGTLGLLDAIEKFNPHNDKGAQFQTYATFRVRGAILDEINSMDWTPRSVRTNIKTVLKTIEKHKTENNTAPTVDEISKATNIDRDSIKVIMGQIDKTFVVQVDNEVMDLAGPTTDFEETELKSMINIAMTTCLTNQERWYITLKFFMGYTNKEIQDALELRPNELKFIRESAVIKLSQELENYKN